MKNQMKHILTVCMLASMFLNVAAYAEVFTEAVVSDGADMIYVAGNPDFYPIEYYNSDTKQYEGLMPSVLAEISQRTGIDFTYLHNDSTWEVLGKNSQVELISAYNNNLGKPFVKAYKSVFSATPQGETIDIGWGFTKLADRKLIDAMHEAMQSISQQQINGYLLSSAQVKQRDAAVIPLFVLCGILTAAIILVFVIKISKLKKQHEKDKLTDPETGMGNLRYLEKCFDGFVSDQNRALYYLAYIAVDRDYLQSYHGSVSFEDSIKYGAQVLTESCENGGFAARAGESGFAFAFAAHNADDAEKRIDEVMVKLNKHKIREELDAEPYFYTAYYGLKNTDRNISVILIDLKRNCNALVGGEVKTILCDVSMLRRAEENKKLLENILEGLKNNEFKLYLQFIVSNKTKKIVSAEALSRWDSPKLGLVTPGRYIRALEDSGHITQLEYYMFRECCRQLEKWQGTVFEGITISCNFARVTLSAADFTEKIKKIADRYKFDKTKLVIEITEDTMEKNFERAIDNIRQCKAMGFKIALDDMGTGYTSFSNLCDYPIDTVKIDREILLKATTKRGRGLFEGIIALAHSIGVKTVCEGVETEEQKQFVDATDCDMIQGWYYSRVLPIKEGEEFAKNYL